MTQTVTEYGYSFVIETVDGDRIGHNFYCADSLRGAQNEMERDIGKQMLYTPNAHISSAFTYVSERYYNEDGDCTGYKTLKTNWVISDGERVHKPYSMTM